MYLIMHGFSRRNAGDGLLVDLTYEALSQAGIDRKRCALLALDPDSFSDLEQVFCAPGEPAARPSLRLCSAGIEIVADAISSMLGPSFGAGRVARLASRARGLIAVGGGYLVADSLVRQMGVMFNHLVQLRVAGRASVPSIYLPQSIGPLCGPVGRATARALGSVDRLYVRDDKSLAEVGGPNVRRCADLAVMKLARELAGATRQERGDNRTVLVGRNLPDAGSYVERLRELQRLVPSPAWAVQADVMGRRSDRAFYQSLGLPDVGPLANILKTRPGVVVSVRLHGAIAALIAGCPAIHLAYERKGWGAYEDLGIAAFVHDARTFDPAKIAQQVDELHRDPGQFWGRIRRAMPVLQAQYEDLVSDLRARLMG
jgi:polysaccharide pyruvyl transferase WcaK-like protein